MSIITPEDIMTDEELLRHYWIISDLEMAIPFKDAPEEDKKMVRKTFGFCKYILAMRLRELEKIICAEIRRLLPRIFRR